MAYRAAEWLAWPPWGRQAKHVADPAAKFVTTHMVSEATRMAHPNGPHGDGEKRTQRDVACPLGERESTVKVLEFTCAQTCWFARCPE